MRLKPVSLEPEGVVSRTLSFEDNARCAVLFGRHHEHLALVEQHLPVTLAARGNLVTISGESEPADAAAAVLEELYRRLEGGLDLSRNEVDAAVRMTVRGPGDVGALSNDDIAIRTERRREAAWPHYLKLRYPTYWHYDVLHGLRVLADVGVDLAGDERAAEALDIVEAARRPDGRWAANGKWWRGVGSTSYPEAVDWGPARPSEMVTFHALRVLKAAGRR